MKVPLPVCMFFFLLKEFQLPLKKKKTYISMYVKIFIILKIKIKILGERHMRNCNKEVNAHPLLVSSSNNKLI